jgi:acyl-CoA synthetase (AMP-forming)/AMP-acid ligase II
MAGSPCPIEVMKRVVNQRDAHAEVTIAYGMTETSRSRRQSATDDRSSARLDRRPRACRTSRSRSSTRRRPHRAGGEPASSAPAAIR